MARPAVTRLPDGRYSVETFRVRLAVHEEPGAVVFHPPDAAAIARAFISTLDADQEHFVAVLLNTRSRVLSVKHITSGTITGSLVSPREVFRAAILGGAVSLVVAHNHPSGDLTLSPEDRALTRCLVEAGKLLDIPIRDHLVLGADSYFSFAEAGLL